MPLGYQCLIEPQTSENSVWTQIERYLPFVEKPTRYIGGEWGSVDPDINAELQVCLIYPDTYEVGQPNQAITILYSILNSKDGINCERCYTPWIDMATILRDKNIPLFSLESTRPIKDFDVLGITLPHELAATNILETLDLAQIPLFAKDRKEDDPIVIAGGPSSYNPEPLAAFFDVFNIGEGEDLLPSILNVIKNEKSKGTNRSSILKILSKMDGVYVPHMYKVNPQFSLMNDEPYLLHIEDNSPIKSIKRAIYTKFSDDFKNIQPIVPFMDVVHDRLQIELLRGCARACRFCSAGMIYRPVRERTSDDVVSRVIHGLKNTGYEEVSLTSLSTTDHSQIQDILTRLNIRLAQTDVSISIPSIRLDSFGVDMALLVSDKRKSGLTFAPEAGSQRMRDIINKNVTEEDLQNVVISALNAGWHRLKLYFMIGLPYETDDDVEAIAQLVHKVLNTAKKHVTRDKQGSLTIAVSVAVFVPKPMTPFQWFGQDTKEEIDHKLDILKNAFKDAKNIQFSYHDSKTSFLEAIISRGGRDVSTLIYKAWQSGACFDAWSEEFRQDAWRKALDEVDAVVSEHATRDYAFTSSLFWDHVDCGVSKRHLIKEANKSEKGLTTEDCTFSRCQACSICDFDTIKNVISVGDVREQ